MTQIIDTINQHSLSIWTVFSYEAPIAIHTFVQEKSVLSSCPAMKADAKGYLNEKHVLLGWSKRIETQVVSGL